MIDIHIQGSAWSEITQELRKMLCDEPPVVVANSTDYEELDAMRNDIRELVAQNCERNARIAELENLLKEKNALIRDKDIKISSLLANIVEDGKIITELKLKLADAEAPKQAEPTEADTETPAPAEEEQTDLPEVTEAPVKEYKKEEVRAVLMQCRAANISITDILTPYGGSLGAVKKEDYGKVVEAAEAALEGK